MEGQFLQINGDQFEGGGQMLRSAVVLSVLLNKPFRMTQIRCSRPNPGINNQLIAILTPFMEKVPKVGSSTLEFHPKVPALKKFTANSSASCTLMMQCLVPIAVFTGYQEQTILQGGTDVSGCPPSRIVKNVLSKLLARMGIILNIQKIKPGYFPQGGGQLVYSVKVDKQVHGIQMTKFSPPTNVSLVFYRVKNILPQSLNQYKKEIKRLMRAEFGEQLMLDIDVGLNLVKGTKQDDYGTSLCLTNQDVVWDCSSVGKPAAYDYIMQILRTEIQNKPALDQNHQDQLLIYMALAHGVSRINIGPHQSNHTKSMIYVLKLFIPQLKISQEDNILTIEGIGYKYNPKPE